MALGRGILLIASAAVAAVASASAQEPPDAETPAEARSTTATSQQHERAEQELQQQLKQRILKIIPDFNTSYIQNAAPLSSGQKFRLAMRSVIDPFTFLVTGIDAGMAQKDDDFAGYGQGAQGYAKRYGASFADNFTGTMFGGAVFPILFHQDPRYFRKGTGSVPKRVLYAMSMTVRAKNDSGRWMANYSNIFGNLAAGGLANAYYPATDRGAGLTVERALIVTAEGAAGNIFAEFWPDIDAKLFHRH